MGKSNTETLKIAQKYLSKGGSIFRKYCGLPAGSAWCNAFVSYIFKESGNATLYCNGKKMTYCPTSIKWCSKNLAQVPLYLAMPMDVIYFDWDKNGVPNHIGFVRAKKDTSGIYTIEGNTGNAVRNKTRPAKYIQAVYRPHYKPSKALKKGKLTIDGDFGYHSIYMLQVALGITADGILGKATVKALQKKAGVSQDGAWGTKTSKAVQKLIGAKQDGAFGPASVKALQKWVNAKVYPATKKTTSKASTAKATTTKTTTTKKTTPKTAAQIRADKAVAWARSIAKGGKYTYKKWNNKDKKTKLCPVCHPSLKGKYKGWNCIGFVSAAWYHGAGLKTIECSCKGIGTDSFFTKVTLASWKKRNGNNWTMITNGGKKGGSDIPPAKLKPGDILICYDSKGKFHHVVLYTGSSKYIDCTNTSSKHIAERAYSVICKKYHVTRAFRYTGK